MFKNRESISVTRNHHLEMFKKRESIYVNFYSELTTATAALSRPRSRANTRRKEMPLHPSLSSAVYFTATKTAEGGSIN